VCDQNADAGYTKIERQHRYGRELSFECGITASLLSYKVFSQMSTSNLCLTKDSKYGSAKKELRTKSENKPRRERTKLKARISSGEKSAKEENQAERFRKEEGNDSHDFENTGPKNAVYSPYHQLIAAR
jgi:hypothetical protein